MATSPVRLVVLVAAGLALVALLVLGAFLLFGGDDAEPDQEPVEQSEPEPEPEPEPDPGPDPVTAEVELAGVVDVSVAGNRVFGSSMAQDQPPDLDQAAVDDFVERIGAWLDEHFTNLQEGGEGSVAAARIEGPTEVTSLTNPDNPVESARYGVVVFARSVPEWARTAVAITREDGTRARADFVFLDQDPLRLIGAEGQGEAWEPPAEEADPDEDAAGGESS